MFNIMGGPFISTHPVVNGDSRAIRRFKRKRMLKKSSIDTNFIVNGLCVANCYWTRSPNVIMKQIGAKIRFIWSKRVFFN